MQTCHAAFTKYEVATDGERPKEMVRRLGLTPGDDKRMPFGADSLPAGEIAIFNKWINYF